MVGLTRDVQRQVFTVNYSLNKSQITRQQLLTLFLDKHLSAIEMHCALFLALHAHFLLMGAGYVEDGFDGERNVSAIVQHPLVRDLSVGQVFIETLILVLSHFRLLTVPDGLERVDGLTIELNWISDKQGILFEDLLDLTFSAELSALWLEFQCDFGTSVEANVVHG